MRSRSNIQRLKGIGRSPEGPRPGLRFYPTLACAHQLELSVETLDPVEKQLALFVRQQLVGVALFRFAENGPPHLV